VKKPGNQFVSPLAAYLIAAVTAAAALLAGEHFIDNRYEKLITGMAAIIIPVGFMVANAIHHAARARVHAAEVLTSPVPVTFANTTSSIAPAGPGQPQPSVFPAEAQKAQEPPSPPRKHR
jgi:hypothetical protein